MNTKKEDNLYKTSAFEHEIHRDLQAHADRFRDPLVLGELMYKILEERENTNRILKNILAKLEVLERFIPAEKPESEPLLADVDEQIMTLIKSQGRASAEEVRSHFNYKGANAASARLNRLFERGLLVKRQAGRKIYFLPVQ